MTLELREDEARQRRDWFVQRCGWACMALVVLATMFGLCGPGPLGNRSARSAAGLRLEYDRFVRVEAPASLRITVPPSEKGSRRAELLIDEGWLRHVHLETIVPEPESIRAANNRLQYTMPPASGSLVVTLHFEPESWGQLEGTIGLSGDTPLLVSQFAYP